MKKFIIVILAIIILMPIRSVSADWAYSFVVYSGDIYEISDDELIPPDEIITLGKMKSVTLITILFYTGIIGTIYFAFQFGK
ncbi:hypothetical protein [Paenibacillus sp.]|uniref:hypothetical protein n=1 Tax=Paenibacillus sp. TaxID=58172 RepID=UPI0028AC4410|nr:hypothetical protein [Paenibacillus sp.]